MISKDSLKIKNTISGKATIVVCILIAIALILILLRVKAEHQLRQDTNEQAVPRVTTITAGPGPLTEKIILPGNVQAFHEATIYARTNGYIKKWYVDIGSVVKKDQLLAEIESPEIDAQLRQAKADLNTAIANAKLAETTAKRWVNLLKTDSVSKQETDEKVSAAKSTAALVAAAKANYERLQQLVGFEKVLAPFDGTITSRTTDVGSLINSGSGSTVVPLFSIIQSDPLRIYVQIPQNYASRIKPDMEVTLHFSEHPGKSYPAKLLKTADAINQITRTLLAQFLADNKNHELLAGGYTEVHFTMPLSDKLIRLPVNTLLFRKEGLQVATVNQDNRVVLKSVTISRDFGNEVEINSGIEVGDKIILNPADSIFDGERVRIVEKNKKSESKKV